MILKDKTVIITGGSEGVGAAAARLFADAGANLMLVARTRKNLEAVADELRDRTRVEIFAMDVTDADACVDVFKKAAFEFGQIDVLVNNAGLVSPMLHFFDADEAWWRRIIDVNLTGHFLCAHQAARIMAKAGGGCIINMSSGGAISAHRAFTAYDASKGGIEALTRAMALDLGPYSIRVNALMPGSIDAAGLDIDQRSLRGENVPLGRIGDPRDITGAALFLASDDAEYITGDVIRIDGGMLAQQRSATVDIMPPSDFPKIENL